MRFIIFVNSHVCQYKCAVKQYRLSYCLWSSFLGWTFNQRNCWSPPLWSQIEGKTTNISAPTSALFIRCNIILVQRHCYASVCIFPIRPLFYFCAMFNFSPLFYFLPLVLFYVRKRNFAESGSRSSLLLNPDPIRIRIRIQTKVFWYDKGIFSAKSVMYVLKSYKLTLRFQEKP